MTWVNWLDIQHHGVNRLGIGDNSRVGALSFDESGEGGFNLDMTGVK